MRNAAPWILFSLAFVIACLTWFGDDSFGRLRVLRASLEVQRQKNALLSQQVRTLRRETIGLERDDRVLEKAARNRLGLVRPDELVVVFDEHK